MADKSIRTKSLHGVQVQKVRDCIKGEDYIRDCGDTYLPKTSGMLARGDAGLKHYDSYKCRARFPEIVQNTENGIIGLAFKEDPEQDIDYDIVTKNRRNTVSLATSQLREVLEAGNSVMLVDAPIGGGVPYIVEYKDENVVAHAVSDEDDSQLTAIKFAEVYFDSGDRYKEKPLDRYREYVLSDGVVTVSLYDDKDNALADDRVLEINYIPAFFAGSVDNLPTRDPIPLLPVANCAIAMYQISADYRQYLHVHYQGTPWFFGVTEEEFNKILEMGTGVGSAFSSENPEATTGMLAPPVGSDEAFIRAIESEAKTAEQYAVSISQDQNGIEAAESIKLRAATKHATIYTIFNSVSTAIEQAVGCMMDWSGKKGAPVFRLNTDFTTIEASAQLVTALNGAINAENLPPSVLKNLARRAGWSDKTDIEMDAEILDRGGVAD